jgi:hypothetical protein
MTFLGPLFITLVVGAMFFCTVFAFAACALSGRVDREEEARCLAKEVRS